MNNYHKEEKQWAYWIVKEDKLKKIKVKEKKNMTKKSGKVTKLKTKLKQWKNNSIILNKKN